MSTNNNDASSDNGDKATLGHIVSDAPPPKSMNDHTRAEYFFTVMVGLCMAFSAGYTNAVCLSGFINVGDASTKQSVAGVTGVYTSSAIAIGENDIERMKFMFGTIGSVMVGAFMASLMNPYPIAFEVSPRYAPTFLLGTIFMMGGAIAALHNERREFFFTAIGNGIQNGVSSMYSANLLRTSHLTGTTTDIGLFCGMALRGNRTNNWKLYILIGLAVSFWVGSIVGFFASREKRQYSLIFNTCFFLAIAISVIARTCVVYKVPFWQAIIGVGKWNTTLDHVEVFQQEKGGDGDVENAVDVDELMKVFDEIDSDNTGKVDQHLLIEHLAAHKVHTKRKKIAAVLHSAFILHGDESDWKISREDWKHLVQQSELVEQSLRKSGRMTVSKSSKSMRMSAASSFGPEALRRMSVSQYSLSPGFHHSAVNELGESVQDAK